jgi:hypothetical protein
MILAMYDQTFVELNVQKCASKHTQKHNLEN